MKMHIDWQAGHIPPEAVAYIYGGIVGQGGFFAQVVHTDSSVSIYHGLKIGGERFCVPMANWAICARPKSDAAGWNGEGLPPVGTVCEYNDLINSQWNRVKILAHFTNKVPVAVFIPDNESQNRTVDQAIAECFRPIRTAEQIAADEREKGIKELMDWAVRSDRRESSQSFVPFWSDLYDRGLRAPE